MCLELVSTDSSTKTVLRYTHSPPKKRCWSREVPVPWKDSFAVVTVGLWSILSTAAFVNTMSLIVGRQTTCSLSNCWQTLFPIWAESWSTRLYDKLISRCDSLSINALLHVWSCNIILMYMGIGISSAKECLTLTDDIPCDRLCLMLLNYNIWVMASAARVVSAIWSLMLDLARIMLTRSSRSEGTDTSCILLRIHWKAWLLETWRCTICAAHARWTSLSSTQALAREAPTSSLNTIREPAC